MFLIQLICFAFNLFDWSKWVVFCPSAKYVKYENFGRLQLNNYILLYCDFIQYSVRSGLLFGKFKMNVFVNCSCVYNLV